MHNTDMKLNQFGARTGTRA